MNTDTPTPETNALIATDQHHLEDDQFMPASTYWRMCDLARKLERERDQWQMNALLKLAVKQLACMWCGELVHAPTGYEPGTPLNEEQRAQAHQQHVATCPAHPIRDVERERDGLQRAYDTAIRQMNQAIAKAEWLRTDAIAKLERERDDALKQLAAGRELANRLAEVIQGVMIKERDLPVTSCRGFLDFDQAILALTAWKSDEGRAISPGVRQFSTTHNTMKNKAAQQLGRLGGKVTSKAKSAAVRENGKKGGRPPKTATAMLIRNARGGWSLCWWKGDVIPSKTFITQEQAREFAVSKNWGVKRLPECDEV